MNIITVYVDGESKTLKGFALRKLLGEFHKT